MLFMRAEATHVPQNAPLIGDSLVTILLTAVSDAPVSFRHSQSTIGGPSLLWLTKQYAGMNIARLVRTRKGDSECELRLSSRF